MKLKKILLIPIGLAVSALGCVGVGPNATYYMGVTSINYDPSYSTYDVNLNNNTIGGAAGSMVTIPVKLGEQKVTWKDSNSGRFYVAKNKIILKREDVKGKKYLVVHLYPDQTIEITPSLNWPRPNEKGLKLKKALRKNKI